MRVQQRPVVGGGRQIRVRMGRVEVADGVELGVGDGAWSGGTADDDVTLPLPLAALMPGGRREDIGVPKSSSNTGWLRSIGVALLSLLV